MTKAQIFSAQEVLTKRPTKAATTQTSRSLEGKLPAALSADEAAWSPGLSKELEGVAGSFVVT